ncbi:MAG TPA: ABC transporter permease [Gemmatimonadaceae bacterium]|nr:ABC transporter permease [Gemmatimonadaceae bacterium]
MLDLLKQDVRYAIRALGRSRLFVIVSVLSIAIGVGATTAIVTLANTLLLRPPPGVGHPERVVTVGATRDTRGFDNFSYPNFVDYRSAARSLAGLAAIRVEPQAVSLAGPSGGEPLQMGAASGNFFEVLEARPALGRFFTPDEDRAPGASPVVVLSHRFWNRRFQADSSIVGKPIVLNGSPFTVVGVAAERFQGPFVIAPDLWVPLTASSLLGLASDIFENRRAVWIMGIGRLAPDVGIGQAQADLSAIATRLAQQYPNENKGRGLAVMPASLFPGDMRPMIAAFLGLLLAVAGLVLMIASTNVAGMLLARASARRREIAVRLALGASRGQLVVQLVIESLLVFAVAGATGLLLAKWLVSGLLALVPRLPVPLAVDPRLDWRVLTFALVVSLVTGLLAGLVPALQSTRPDLVPTLKSDTGGTGTRQRLRLRSGLLVAQIAFSMLLLVVGGLFARALTHAREIDPGFDPRGVYVASLDLGLANNDSISGRRVAATILERARGIPGVRSAALSTMLPLDGGGLGLGSIKAAGREPPAGQDGWREDWNVVTPGYFATMGTPLVRGRDFTESDRAGAADVAILNEAFAGVLFPGQDAVGRTLTNDDRVVTIIGLARNAKYRSLGEAQRNFIYVPLAQRYMGRTNLLVKTTSGPSSVAAPIRRLLQDVDARLPILRQQTMEEQTATSLFPQRVALYVSGGLGTVALLLALLGIYGVTAFSVSQRTREIGVRTALGAQRSHVIGLVLRQGVVLAAVGVFVGSLAAFGATRLLASLLYGMPATDVVAFGGAALALAVAAVAASWIPARRAARVDPIIALRSE